MVKSGGKNMVGHELSVPPPRIGESADALCRAAEGLGAAYCDVLDLSNNLSTGRSQSSKNPVIEILVDAQSKPMASEATVVAFVYGADTREQAFNLGLSLTNQTLSQSPYLSKRVVILLIESRCGERRKANNDHCTAHLGANTTKTTAFRRSLRHSQALSDWLRYNPTSDVEAGSSRLPFIGLVRDAWVVELLPPSGARAGAGAGAGAGGVAPIALHATGLNGNLPNMDMVSAPLALHPGLIRPGYITALPHRSLVWEEALSGVLQQLALALNSKEFLSSEQPSSPSSAGWRGRLLGLCSHGTALLSGPDGLHSQFLQRNIDSVSLRVPLAKLGPSAGSSSSQSGVSNKELLGLIGDLVRLSSNLHEHLHHSHFFFILLGRQHFVSLQEYGVALLAVAAPAILLFVSWSKRVSADNLGDGIAALAVDLLLPSAVVTLNALRLIPFPFFAQGEDGQEGGDDQLIKSAALLCFLFVAYISWLLLMHPLQQQLLLRSPPPQALGSSSGSSLRGFISAEANRLIVRLDELSGYLSGLALTVIALGAWAGCQNAVAGVALLLPVTVELFCLDVCLPPRPAAGPSASASASASPVSSFAVAALVARSAGLLILTAAPLAVLGLAWTPKESSALGAALREAVLDWTLLGQWSAPLLLLVPSAVSAAAARALSLNLACFSLCTIQARAARLEESIKKDL
jgi:hypothetical protein